MPVSCIVSNCKNRLQKGSGKSFHRFPFSKPDLIERWLTNIRREGWKPSKYSHICSDHFDDDCYIGGPHRRRVLKSDAVPTKFNCDNQKIAISLSDHSEEELNDIDDSAKPSENGLFKLQEEFESEDSYSKDLLSEEELSDSDHNLKLSSDITVKKETVDQDICDQKWKVGTPKAIAIPETSKQLFIRQQQMLPHHANLSHNKRFHSSDLNLQASSKASGNLFGSVTALSDGEFTNQSLSFYKDNEDINYDPPDQFDSSTRNAYFSLVQKRTFPLENEEQLRIKLLKNRILQEKELYEMKVKRKKQKHELDLAMKLKLHKLLINHQNELHQLKVKKTEEFSK